MQYNYKTIIENIYDGLYLVDLTRKITYWNPAAERITGFSRSAVVGHPCFENILVHVDYKGCELCTGECPLSATMNDGIAREVEIFLRHREGHRVPVTAKVTPLKNAADRIVGGIEIFSISRSPLLLKQKIADLERLALLDHLTELPNRRQLNLELIAQSAMAARTAGYSFGILYFDIDHFKRINDEEGHEIGDQTLRVAAKTMAGSIRPFDTIGRWGGDEFLGVFPNIGHKELQSIAERMMTLIRASSVETVHGPIRVTVSVGGIVSKSSENIESLIQKADALMYQSKEAGRDRAIIV
jgi:diguanylate cyclase (GGDEF)-like protein/PAS domain S-box-containing protein